MKTHWSITNIPHFSLQDVQKQKSRNKKVPRTESCSKWQTDKLAKKFYSLYKADPRHVDAWGSLIIWYPFKSISLNFLRLGQGRLTWMRGRAKIAENFQRNSFACGNLNVWAPYFLASFIGWYPGKLAGLPAPYSGSVLFQSRKITPCKTRFPKWFYENLNILRRCSVLTGKYLSTFRKMVVPFVLRIRQSNKGDCLVMRMKH